MLATPSYLHASDEAISHLNNPQKKNPDHPSDMYIHKSINNPASHPGVCYILYHSLPCQSISFSLVKQLSSFTVTRVTLSSYVYINKTRHRKKEGLVLAEEHRETTLLARAKMDEAQGRRRSRSRRKGTDQKAIEGLERRGISRILHLYHSVCFPTPCVNLPIHLRNILKAWGAWTTSIYRASLAFSSIAFIRPYSVSSFLLELWP